MRTDDEMIEGTFLPSFIRSTSSTFAGSHGKKSEERRKRATSSDRSPLLLWACVCVHARVMSDDNVHIVERGKSVSPLRAGDSVFDEDD